MKKISSLEFKLNQILDDYRHGQPSLNEDCEPMTRQEHEQQVNENLRRQLGRFRNATTGEKLLPGIGDSDE